MTKAVGIAGSPAPASKSRRLLDVALKALSGAGLDASVVDLARLPANALLGRGGDAAVDEAVQRVLAAGVIVAATPVYRATYSGLLKVFFDLLPPDSLSGKVAVPIATGGGPAHHLAVDLGLRPLFASLGAIAVPTGVYGVDAQFREGWIAPELVATVERAAGEAAALAAAWRREEAGWA